MHPNIKTLVQRHVLIQQDNGSHYPSRDPYTNMRYIGVMIDPLGVEVPMFFNPEIDPTGIHTLSTISGYMRVESQRFDVTTQGWSTVETPIKNPSIPGKPRVRNTHNPQPAMAELGL